MPIPPRRFGAPPGIRPQGATGIPVERPNRNMPSQAANMPAVSQGKSDRQTETFTYFTTIGPQPNQGGTPVLYNGDRLWANVTVTLETAGPVAVGTRSELFPVLSGKGVLLDTDVPKTFVIGKGYSRLYIASTSINRVKVEIEPFPWIEQIAGGVDAVQALLQALLQRK